MTAVQRLIARWKPTYQTWTLTISSGSPSRSSEFWHMREENIEMMSDRDIFNGILDMASTDIEVGGLFLPAIFVTKGRTSFPRFHLAATSARWTPCCWDVYLLGLGFHKTSRTLGRAYSVLRAGQLIVGRAEFLSRGSGDENTYTTDGISDILILNLASYQGNYGEPFSLWHTCMYYAIDCLRLCTISRFLFLSRSILGMIPLRY